jgi:hypothetical protein
VKRINLLYASLCAASSRTNGFIGSLGQANNLLPLPSVLQTRSQLTSNRSTINLDIEAILHRLSRKQKQRFDLPGNSQFSAVRSEGVNDIFTALR